MKALNGRRWAEKKPDLNNPVMLMLGCGLIFVVYLWLACSFLLSKAVWSPDEGAKLLQLHNLKWNKNILNFELAYPGMELDAELEYATSDPKTDLLEVRGGKWVFQRLPIFPILVFPFFRWLGYPGIYILPALFGALIGPLALLLISGSRRNLLMWLTISFGSPIFIYSIIYWEHTLVVALGLLAALLATWIGESVKIRPSREYIGWLLVGLLVSLGVFLRLEMIIFGTTLATACFFIYKEHRRGIMLAIGLVGLLLLLYQPAHKLLLGGEALPRNALFLFYPLAYLRHAGWQAVVDVLIGPAEDMAIQSGWPGVVWSIAAILAIITSLSWFQKQPWRNLHLTALTVSGVAALYFLIMPTEYRSAHGLIFTTPWALLGVTRAREVWSDSGQRGKVIVLTTILGLLGYIIGMVGFRASSPHGGLEWGTRLALVFYPLLAIIAAWGISKKSPAEKTIIIGLLILGIGFQVRGLLSIRQDKLMNDSINQVILDSPEYYTISNLWWLSLNSSPIYPAKAIQLAASPQEISTWIQLARRKGVKSFALLTEDAGMINQVIIQSSNLNLKMISTTNIGDLIHYRLAIDPP